MLNLSIYDGLQMRLATTDDVHEVMKLVIAAAEENSLVNASQELLLRAIWPALNQDHGMIGCIGKAGGEIEGIVVLRMGTLFYSPEPCIEECVVYVKPEHRSAKGGRARKLCEFSKSVALTLELPLIIGIFSSVDTQPKIALYKRIFGEPTGLYFLFNGKTGGRKTTEPVELAAVN